jgi:hypothetical protein
MAGKFLRTAGAICALAICSLPHSANGATSVFGVVHFKPESCDYFTVLYKVGSSYKYAVLEWYGGYEPDEGDGIRGPLRSSGMHGFYDTDAEESLRAYVDEYDLDSSGAEDKVNDSCS